MRGWVFIGFMGLAACSNTSAGRDHVTTAPRPAVATPAQSSPPSKAPTLAPVETARPGPFAGVWEACDAGGSPDECSRYVLVQRGDRICGTWSYFATGAGYEGRVIAHMVSPVEARRTQVCGRPGSEAQTECDAGWDQIDKRFRLCNGKLGDLETENGSCFAQFVRASKAEAQLAEVAAQPWLETCLAGTPPGAAK